MKKHVQAGWDGWSKVSGVMCDKRVSARMDREMVMGIHGDTVALKKRQEAELEVVEIEILGFSMGSGMSTSEGQRMLDVLGRQSERPDRDGLGIYRGEIVTTLVEG